MVSTVQSANSVRMVPWIRSSVSRSTAAVASSRIRILVLRNKALARHSSWRWPTLKKIKTNSRTPTEVKTFKRKVCDQSTCSATGTGCNCERCVKKIVDCNLVQTSKNSHIYTPLAPPPPPPKKKEKKNQKRNKKHMQTATHKCTAFQTSRLFCVAIQSSVPGLTHKDPAILLQCNHRFLQSFGGTGLTLPPPSGILIQQTRLPSSWGTVVFRL